MFLDCMKSGVLWQRAKKGHMPWYPLPVPKGPPVVYSPEPTPPAGLIHCYLKPAHDPEQMYVVHVPCTATVADVLNNLEAITKYAASSMAIVKEGSMIATYEHAFVCNPMSFLLVGDKLHCVDVCTAQAADWSDLWSVSHTTDQITPRGGVRRLACEGMIEETYEVLFLTSRVCRGGVRADRNVQQPRAVMLLWAEDKIKREVDGVNILTVRMLLKAEQRTVSAILHAKSPAQTKEVLLAAYRSAVLVMRTTSSLPGWHAGHHPGHPQPDNDNIPNCREAGSVTYESRLRTLAGIGVIEHEHAANHHRANGAHRGVSTSSTWSSSHGRVSSQGNT